MQQANVKLNTTVCTALTITAFVFEADVCSARKAVNVIATMKHVEFNMFQAGKLKLKLLFFSSGKMW